MDYRLLRMKIGGDIGHVAIGHFPDDAAALRQGEAFGRGRAVEVWAGDRRVATLLPRVQLQS